jgi:hypothetical protein
MNKLKGLLDKIVKKKAKPGVVAPAPIPARQNVSGVGQDSGPLPRPNTLAAKPVPAGDGQAPTPMHGLNLPALGETPAASVPKPVAPVPSGGGSPLTPPVTPVPATRPTPAPAPAKSGGLNIPGLGGGGFGGNGKKPSFGGGNNSFDWNSIPPSLWVGLIILVLMSLMIIGVGFFGTGNTGVQLQSFETDSISSIPIVLLFFMLSFVMTIAETWQRGDLSDFVVFVLALVLNIIAKETMNSLFKFTNVLADGTMFPTGAVIFGFLLGVASAILIYAVIVNKTGNLFGGFRFDFTASYMFFLSAWAFAKINEIWGFWPDPTFINENIYLIIGLVLLVIESARLWQYLIISLLVGVLTAVVIFTDFFYLIPIAYLGEVLIAVLWLGKQGSITTESAGGGKAEGTNQSSGVRLGNVATRLFVPWDLVIASFWFGAVLINIMYGNQAFLL